MKNSRSGQSLIEVVVSMAIVVVVILALVSVTTISIRNASFSRNQSLATKYAQEAIEKVREYRDKNNWQTFTAGCESPSGLTLPPPLFSRTIDCHLVSLSTNCCSTPGQPSCETCQVDVSVSWTDSQGIHQSQLTTRFTSWK